MSSPSNDRLVFRILENFEFNAARACSKHGGHGILENQLKNKIVTVLCEL